MFICRTNDKWPCCCTIHPQIMFYARYNTPTKFIQNALKPEGRWDDPVAVIGSWSLRRARTMRNQVFVCSSTEEETQCF